MKNSQSSIINHQSIVFFGSGAYTIPVIEVLKKFDLKLIVTTDQGDESGRYASEFKKYLSEQIVPVLVSNLKSKEDQKKIIDLEPSIGILASYGAILPQDVIDIFPHGILNIHPSLLPKYKGSSPIQTTILNNELATGVTIIKLDHQVDHGPIVEQGTVQLKGTETTQDLKKYLFGQGAKLIEKILTELETGDPLITHEQDHTQESFTKKIKKSEGEIKLDTPPDPGTLDRMIRAYYPWPGVFFEARIKNKELRIKLLPNNTIQVEGKKIMSFKDFLNGYPEGKIILERLHL